MKGCGASLGELSHHGNSTRQTQPTTIMAMMLPLRHPSLAVAARVKGTRISEMAADRSSRPITSSSYHSRRNPAGTLCPFQSGSRSIPIRAAFRWFTKSASARGRNATGSTIAHTAYPHRHDPPVRRNRSLASGAPAHTVTRKGRSGSVDSRARFRRSLVSAMNTWVRIRAPVAPAE